MMAILTNTAVVCFGMILIAACTRSKSSTDIAVGPYSEKHRPQFHFSPQSNWMNDPNGLIYFEGEYHLFYQYYPDSTVWGPMHWGHAVSKDLVKWEHLPIALYPDSLGYIFSGSAVIDDNNTSGLGRDGNPPMIAIFTHHDPQGEKIGEDDFQYQSIAYSNDKGRSWHKYDDNPVIENPGIRDFRDPKVIWVERYSKWVMVFAANDRIKFYSSPDLISWTFESDFGKGHGNQGRPWECPDLFPLQSDDGELKWVLIVSVGKDAANGGSGTQYFIGEFDGSKFTNDNDAREVLWLDYGKDNYAGVTWSGLDGDINERTFIGWMSNWQYAQTVPTYPWRSAMTVPRSLKLIQTDQGSRLVSNPSDSLYQLKNDDWQSLPLGEINEEIDLLSGLDHVNGLYEIVIEAEVEQGSTIDFIYENDLGERLGWGYDGTNNSYFLDRTFSGDHSFSEDFGGLHTTGTLEYTPSIVQMRILIDLSSIEIFADGGRTVITELFYPSEPFDQLKLQSSGGKIKILKGDVHSLRSVW